MMCAHMYSRANCGWWYLGNVSGKNLIIDSRWKDIEKNLRKDSGRATTSGLLLRENKVVGPLFSFGLLLSNVQDPETDTSLSGESSSVVDDLNFPIAVKKEKCSYLTIQFKIVSSHRFVAYLWCHNYSLNAYPCEYLMWWKIQSGIISNDMEQVERLINIFTQNLKSKISLS